MAKSPEELAHLEWLGYVQPVGLVVSVPAMLEAQCYVGRNIMAEHARFLGCLPRDSSGEIIPEIHDLSAFAQKVLGWDAEDLKEVPQRTPLSSEMASLEVVLPQYHETLRPTQAVPVFRPAEGENPWLMLIQEHTAETQLDQPDEADSARHWNAAPQAKFERLLRETGVPIGLLSNRRQLRLVYSPRGESSGYATFNVSEMIQVAGRPVFAALHSLLCTERIVSLGANQRLPAILENSRKYQNTVSTKLAEQVLAALYELMRGFQAADDVRNGDLLREILANDPNHVYSGLLTVLMRLVFVMYAEDRDLLSSDAVYSNYYSVTGLFNRLREDAGRHPDTMNQRFGAWSQLATLFRLVYEGGQHGDFKLPARKGYLFDPDRYPFLEGRQRQAKQADDSFPIPRISDGVIYKVLRNLLILDGERLSYRTLDVEQIGSVYETVMGFNLEVAEGKSIAIKPAKSHGAPATINLDALLSTKGKDRAKWLKEQSDQALGKEAATKLKDATKISELLEALDKKIAKKVTPRVVPAGAIVLQPSDERRRSGSHYTPRSLTEPIVRTTLEPILKQLCDPQTPVPDRYTPSKEDKRRYTHGELDARILVSERAIEYAKRARQKSTPHPSQILDLKICDPAMGSGAFLVETCRQLGDELIKAWYAHDSVPTDIPPDEDEVLYARRLVAQRCLYGVDKNIMAVDLAKLSLWLVTLAKDHPFTFLDHSLRHGDSLVGLTRSQIIGFHWEPKKQKQFGEDLIQRRLDRATEARAKILNAREDVPYRDQEQRLALADEAMNVVRLIGDACVSSFFARSKKKEREERCEELFASVSEHFQNLKDGRLDTEVRGRIATAVANLKNGKHPLPPFHWEIEFPEVFSREDGGFDAIVGNPPFLGGTKISSATSTVYLDFLKSSCREGGNRTDLVAYFFRSSFDKLRDSGALGLIATNTVAQGDTRSAGLRIIRQKGGIIYNATRRFKWPGFAAVIVNIVHIAKSNAAGVPCYLDGKNVDRITAYLFHAGGDENPSLLLANSKKSFEGYKLAGQGFLFDDDDVKATPISTMRELLSTNPANRQHVFPYLGGSQINSDPMHRPDRYAIDFGTMELEEAENWPDLMRILRDRVKPERDRSARPAHRKYWWRYGETRPGLTAAIDGLKRVLVCCQTSKYLSFAFVPTGIVYSHKVVVFALHSWADFATLQSRAHQEWAFFFGSTMKDDPVYTSTDCFRTFPFPKAMDGQKLNARGQDYYDNRAQEMAARNEGLTDLLNRFHDPLSRSAEILHIRELHEAMDRAVLEAYGWDDLAASARCEFILDYKEEDEEVGNKRPRKKQWRLRWPDEFRDRVLARLLELNEQRHKEELLIGSSQPSVKRQPQGSDANSTKKTKKTATVASGQKELFNDVELTPEDRNALIVVAAWGDQIWVGRDLFGEAMVLWVNNKHRLHLLGQEDEPQRAPRSAGAIAQIIGRAIINEWIEVRPTDGSLRLLQTPSPVGTLKPAEKKKVEEIRAAIEVIRKTREGVIVVTEDSINATENFVSA